MVVEHYFRTYFWTTIYNEHSNPENLIRRNLKSQDQLRRMLWKYKINTTLTTTSYREIKNSFTVSRMIQNENGGHQNNVRGWSHVKDASVTFDFEAIEKMKPLYKLNTRDDTQRLPTTCEPEFKTTETKQQEQDHRQQASFYVSSLLST